MPFKSIKEVSQYLESIPKFQTSGKSAANFDLERFRKFCEAMGNPQDDFPSVHVGGTNGKGSTCQILAAVYQHAGFKTGIYTSPHILEYTERFKINGDVITDSYLLEFFNRHESLLKSFRLSYFEISTAIAFWYFGKMKVDLAIIEVGLGGRLDATNVITPEVSVITNISLDHTDLLGETVPEIAAEKGGIIKKGVPVVLGNVSNEAENVLKKIARTKEAPLVEINKLRPQFRSGKYIL
ncbi:MAG: bifunctional folylpolyglutamate synthase/dihydrofolate synthase, partial [Candidatus Halalkalibacterium sp. M3_1C_030]